MRLFVRRYETWFVFFKCDQDFLLKTAGPDYLPTSIMERKVKQWWLTIPSISTKRKK
jgi:hypothetical protein